MDIFGSIPVDRHGFMLAPGNTVTKIADGTRFVVTTVERSRHNPTEPTEWTLYDDNNTSVSAKNVMLDDTEQRRRASYCQHCGNHFNTYFDWQSGCGCIITNSYFADIRVLHYKRTKAKAAGLVLFFALKLITIARRVVRRMYSPGGSGYAIARAHFYHTATAPPHSLL